MEDSKKLLTFFVLVGGLLIAVIADQMLRSDQESYRQKIDSIKSNLPRTKKSRLN